MERNEWYRVLPEGVRLLEDAVQRDPKFLSAWTLLARLQGYLYWFGLDSTPAQLDRLRNAVQAAVRLQPDAGETHLALAEFYYHGYRDYDRAPRRAGAGASLPAEQRRHLCLPWVYQASPGPPSRGRARPWSKPWSWTRATSNSSSKLL